MKGFYGGKVKKIKTLEYRLNQPEKDYPAIFHFDYLMPIETVLRKSCDYVVVNGVNYKVMSAAFENNLHVLYMEEDFSFSIAPDYDQRRDARIEFRDVFTKELIHIHSESDSEELLSILFNDFIPFEGEEKSRTAVQVDEDRHCFVMYLEDSK